MLKQLRREWASLRQHEFTPLVQSNHASDFPSSVLVFDGLAVFENQRFDAALATSEPEWRERVFRWFEQTRLGLTLRAYGDPAMTLKLEYDVLRFSREIAQRMLGHVVQAFASVAANPSEAIGKLDLLTAEEREQILVDWNLTESEYPGAVSLAALVEAQVARTPQATAVVFDEKSLTYRELNERANQLARELVKQGAGPDQLVGIFVERSLEMMIALLAVAKSGAGYLPLDPYLPAARLHLMIDDSGLCAVVTQTDLRSELPQFRGGVVTLDSDEWRANSDENLDAAVKPEHIAYVIYTSGSTGKPKGVEVSYQSLVNLLWSVKDWLKFKAFDRLLAVTTISFDIAGADIWLPWLVGATTILASREAAEDGTQLRRLIERHDITFLQATPVTWWLLLGAGWTGKPDLQIVCTGEAMPHELAALLAPKVSRLWNLYGPTETTIWSTGYLVEDGQAPVLIGRPLGNTQCYILDGERQPVPIGCAGELYIAGDGLARGYLNRPELTAEKFVPNPFSLKAGARMYRTGDLARYLPDGNIECLGRTDHQVKIRGFRIELGEIETALKQHPEIRQAVVVAREDTATEKRLVGYFVPSGARAPDRTELRSFLKQQLPEYMVPADYVALESLPISPNGKIDRKALPAPAPSQHADLSFDRLSFDRLSIDRLSFDMAVAPRNETERKLLKIFSQVLGSEKIGINDNFFEAGGHSFTAVRAISLVGSELKIDLPVRILFQAQTVSQLAAIILERNSNETNHSSEEWPACIPIQPNGSKVPLFCVARPNVNALGYLFLSRHLGPDQPVYGLQRQMPEDPAVNFTPEQIRETAEEYIRVMRSVQSHGPYYFIGQCQGAYIAFEMARQLELQAERIDMLGILDVWPEENTRHKLLFFCDAYMRKFLKLFTRSASHSATVSASPPRNNHNNIHMNGDASAAAPRAFSGDPRWKLYWPGPSFKPVTISSKIVVFRLAAQRFYRIHDKEMGWGKRTSGPVEVEQIAGDHLSFLRDPHVKGLAEKISSRMKIRS